MCGDTEKHRRMSVFFLRVAGPGLEPGSGGYEPPEVPLLYPAMNIVLFLHRLIQR